MGKLGSGGLGLAKKIRIRGVGVEEELGSGGIGGSWHGISGEMRKNPAQLY